MLHRSHTRHVIWNRAVALPQTVYVLREVRKWLMKNYFIYLFAALQIWQWAYSRQLRYDKCTYLIKQLCRNFSVPSAHAFSSLLSWQDMLLKNHQHFINFPKLFGSLLHAVVPHLVAKSLQSQLKNRKYCGTKSYLLKKYIFFSQSEVVLCTCYSIFLLKQLMAYFVTNSWVTY